MESQLQGLQAQLDVKASEADALQQSQSQAQADLTAQLQQVQHNLEGALNQR